MIDAEIGIVLGVFLGTWLVPPPFIPNYKQPSKESFLLGILAVIIALLVLYSKSDNHLDLSM